MKLAVCELPTSASQDRNVRVSTLGQENARRSVLALPSLAMRVANRCRKTRIGSSEKIA
jgi:hypothetical protein